MIPSLKASVLATIHNHQMLQPGDRVAIAVSGGADSVALLRLFEELRADLGITLSVVHFNHQLRSAESDGDEKFVALLARQRGFAFVSDGGDVAAAATRHGWNLEDAGRRLRYDFFAKVIADGGATLVATAHTADDQAETVLARLIRGTGPTGLGSICPVRDSIIRPLLEVRRKSLRTYLTSINQEWREDTSNLDAQRLRARVRQRLLPEMEGNFSASIVNKLSSLAELARDDERFWVALVDECCNRIVTRQGQTAVVNVRELLGPMRSGLSYKIQTGNVFHALTQRIVRRLYDEMAANGELSRKHVENVIEFAESGGSGRRIELPGGVQVSKEFDQLIFSVRKELDSRDSRVPASVSYAYTIDLADKEVVTVTVPELGRRFHLKVIDWPGRERETRSEGVVLDAERLRPPLILRNWKPGDAYCPKGHLRPQKLARMMMAGRIRASRRASWPVLISQGRIAWVDQMPVAGEFSASEATRTGLWIVEDDG